MLGGWGGMLANAVKDNLQLTLALEAIEGVGCITTLAVQLFGH